MTCDWGDCDALTIGWRWWYRPLGYTPLLLPVCARHEPMQLGLTA